VVLLHDLSPTCRYADNLVVTRNGAIVIEGA
jgi:ABC-type hemin transport system ATPase subunit